MRKKLIVAMALVVLLTVTVLTGCTVGTAAQGDLPQTIDVNMNNQQTGIWVSGQGKVTATPDITIVSLGISAQAATVAEAQSQAATAMDKVMSALKSNGVDSKDIQTQYFSIQQVRRWDEITKQEVIVGYSVNNTVTVKVRAIDKAGSTIDAVAEAGGDLTRVNGISFTVEDPTAYQKLARDKAMADAKAKAEQMANLADVTLGKPTYISESSYYPVPMPTPIYRDAAGVSAPSTPISAGEMDITVNVQVTYEIL